MACAASGVFWTRAHDLRDEGVGVNVDDGDAPAADHRAAPGGRLQGERRIAEAGSPTTIPAVAPATFLRKSLRFGMVLSSLNRFG